MPKGRLPARPFCSRDNLEVHSQPSISADAYSGRSIMLSVIFGLQPRIEEGLTEIRSNPVKGDCNLTLDDQTAATPRDQQTILLKRTEQSMKFRHILPVSIVLAASLTSQAQQTSTANQTPGQAKPPRMAYYIDPTVLDVSLLLADPPATDSDAAKAELAELHRIETNRTPEQIAKAKADETEEDMFAYKSVFGPAFTPEFLPITAALGEHVKNEQSVVGASLKQVFQRPRPFQTDATLHPVCELTIVHNSYPSGHALTGYLEALTLAEIVPEKRGEILARADDYAYSRMLCGVHYRSDLEASRKVSYVVFGYMLATPRFQHDLAAARAEMRTKLGLPQR